MCLSNPYVNIMGTPYAQNSEVELTLVSLNRTLKFYVAIDK